MITKESFPHYRPEFRRASRFCLLAVVLAGWSMGAVRALHADETADWDRITGLQQELAGETPVGQNSVEFEAPIEAKLHEATGAFTRDYPSSGHHWDAALLELKTVAFPAPADQRRDIFREQEAKVCALLADPAAPEIVRTDAERTLIRQKLDHLDLIVTPKAALDLEERLSALIGKNPGDPKMGALQLRRVDLLAKADPVRARALLQTFADDPNPEISGSAKGRLAQEAFAGRPLDWKFTDVQGRSFDAAQYRGKVVLIDFWATWCPDCLRELPKVIETYNRLHDAGFEIIGVSLDKKKEALTSFIQKRAMPWPQYFDGKGWEASLATQYGVRGVPEMWLLDKEGHLVATGLHSDELEQRVTALLHP